MGRLHWLVAVMTAACGNVAKTTDAGVDGPEPDAFACPAPQLTCGGSCVTDPMTDNQHCGACDVACKSGTTCQAGHCVDMVTSCHQIHDINNAAPNGVYTLIDLTPVYCDMTNMLQYDTLMMGQFDSNPAGFTILGAADLTNAVTGPIFTALYNAQGGLKVVTPFMSGNCCFKNDANNTNTMLFMNSGSPATAQDVYPASAGAKLCSPAGGYVTTMTYQFALQPDTATPVFANAPLPPDFFTAQHPPVATAGCSAAANPAIFWKKHTW